MKNILTPGIFTIPHFLSEEECDFLIDFSEQRGYEEAAISMGSKQVIQKEIRNNQRILYDDPKMAEGLWSRLKSYMPDTYGDMVPFGLNERLRFYKYSPGQEFKAHQDGRFIRNKLEWSLFTFMVYLNEGMQGGETKFLVGAVKPQKGMALVFRHSFVHEGCMLLDGVKYVIRSDVMYRKVKEKKDRL